MTDIQSHIVFTLKPKTELVPTQAGGVVLQWNPLRAMRVNAAAYRVLDQCRRGFSVPSPTAKQIGQIQDRIPAFLDTLCRAEIVDWTPPQNRYEPHVSIIVPVYNRAHEIGGCIESLLALNYPTGKREIIVVDDASQDHSSAVVRQYDVKLIVLPRNMGQSAARNAGVRAAGGEIIAFIDSDCIADPAWLSELVPYLYDRRYVLVGGYVDSFYRQSPLDRYESVSSALNMGPRKTLGIPPESVFYVPTCNMLVRKDAYLEAGGLDEALRVGEDVDLCWKLMQRDYREIYVPQGPVKHKHRNQFWQTFKRRFDYGTSEALLYARHRRVTKRLPWQPAGYLFLIACMMGLLTGLTFLWPLAVVIALIESVSKQRLVEKRFDVSISLWKIIRATVRSHFALAYYVTFHGIRYYLLPCLLLAVVLPNSLPLLLTMVLLPSAVEYYRKKPQLHFAWFLFYFCAEQLFYQVGVIRGCFRKKSFRLFRISFVRFGPAKSG